MIQTIDRAVERFLRRAVPLPDVSVDVSFEAPERGGGSQIVDQAFVEERLRDVREDRDLSRYIL